MARRVDRRIERTQQLLRGALVSLIRERGYEELSVQDIIDRANVGRATFYAHFDSKEDLLVSGFEGLRASLKEGQRAAHASGKDVAERVFGFSHELFTHTNEHREVFRMMVGKRSGGVVQQTLQRIIVDLIREDLKAMMHGREAGTARTEALVQFVAGGLNGLMSWWLTGKPRVSVEEVNELFRRWAIPVLREAVREPGC